MKRNKQPHSNRATARKLYAAIAATLLSCGVAAADTYTWIGLSGQLPPFFTPNPYWSDAGNWASPIPVSADTTDIVFGPSAMAISLQNLAQPFVLRSLTFSASGLPYVLDGGQLSLQAIHQNSPVPVTVLNPLDFGSLQYTGSGSATLAGALSGGNLTVNTTGTLTLSGGGNILQLEMAGGAAALTGCGIGPERDPGGCRRRSCGDTDGSGFAVRAERGRPG